MMKTMLLFNVKFDEKNASIHKYDADFIISTNGLENIFIAIQFSH